MTPSSKYFNLSQSQRLELLQGVLAAEWSVQLQASQLVDHLMSRPVDPRLYALYMLETYHYTFHNARNQALVGIRARGVRPQYMKFCFEHAEEETGHEKMALHDVNSMGFRLREEDLPLPPPQTEVLIAYLYWVSERGNPLQRLGYSFWAEDVYGFIDPMLQKVKSDLRLSNSQMTFFVAHSAIDEDHAEEVRRVLVENCTEAQDWEDVERVMLTSLRLTFAMMEGVLEEYLKIQRAEGSPYAELLGQFASPLAR